jgi:hypothetical protein
MDVDATRRLMIASQPNFTVPFYQTGRMVITRPPVQRWLSTAVGADVDDSCHGKLLVIALTKPSAACNLLVELRWEVEVSEQTV